MAQSNLPPQAYTREVFAKAYEWLRTQPETMKKLASSPDELVAMYLQARRHRQGRPPEGTKSSQSFKSELKNLARGIEQFEKGEPIRDEQEQITSTLAPGIDEDQNEIERNDKIVGPTAEPNPSKEQATQDLATKSFDLNQLQKSLSKSPEKAQSSDQIENLLDPRSLEMLSFVQNRFNLSSPSEALRMMIVLGYEKVCETHSKL